ncbi:helix-turn-helix transcriptional regulator [Tissierella creatinophila]|uniref:Helix-turn-helix domain protein n=1 Tax=Tissierella creatinophila DSM 6911 TaxID=1123403 RepID=A0A1U7M6V0_TISCR|nr:helix-turn-helix transcriptional regulator [Tissierella creatinophila]OLS02918.1 helix-turn-helix domain protein [Tissierella creatinophila DSM 6911]
MFDLKEIRLKNNKTQQQMADMLNIGLTTYHQYETSDRDIPYLIAKKIADIFEVNLEDIFLPTRFTLSKNNKNSK